MVQSVSTGRSTLRPLTETGTLEICTRVDSCCVPIVPVPLPKESSSVTGLCVWDSKTFRDFHESSISCVVYDINNSNWTQTEIDVLLRVSTVYPQSDPVILTSSCLVEGAKGLHRRDRVKSPSVLVDLSDCGTKLC